MILLALDRTPGTIEDVATSLSIPIQVAGSTVARLMQFGLIEVRFSPAPQLATSSIGQDFIRLGGALNERTEIARFTSVSCWRRSDTPSFATVMSKPSRSIA